MLSPSWISIAGNVGQYNETEIHEKIVEVVFIVETMSVRILAFHFYLSFLDFYRTRMIQGVLFCSVRSVLLS